MCWQDASGRVIGARVRDAETGEAFDVRATRVVNATGPFTDAVRAMDHGGKEGKIIQPSSGVHLILAGYFCANNMGFLNPNTSDGRVVFMLPWLGQTLVGTTGAQRDVFAYLSSLSLFLGVFLDVSILKYYLFPFLSHSSLLSFCVSFFLFRARCFAYTHSRSLRCLWPLLPLFPPPNPILLFCPSHFPSSPPLCLIPMYVCFENDSSSPTF